MGYRDPQGGPLPFRLPWLVRAWNDADVSAVVEALRHLELGLDEGEEAVQRFVTTCGPRMPDDIRDEVVRLVADGQAGAALAFVRERRARWTPGSLAGVSLFGAFVGTILLGAAWFAYSMITMAGRLEAMEAEAEGPYDDDEAGSITEELEALRAAQPEWSSAIDAALAHQGEWTSAEPR